MEKLNNKSGDCILQKTPVPHRFDQQNQFLQVILHFKHFNTFSENKMIFDFEFQANEVYFISCLYSFQNLRNAARNDLLTKRGK